MFIHHKTLGGSMQPGPVTNADIAAYSSNPAWWTATQQQAGVTTPFVMMPIYNANAMAAAQAAALTTAAFEAGQPSPYGRNMGGKISPPQHASLPTPAVLAQLGMDPRLALQAALASGPAMSQPSTPYLALYPQATANPMSMSPTQLQQQAELLQFQHAAAALAAQRAVAAVHQQVANGTFPGAAAQQAQMLPWGAALQLQAAMAALAGQVPQAAHAPAWSAGMNPGQTGNPQSLRPPPTVSMPPGVAMPQASSAQPMFPVQPPAGQWVGNGRGAKPAQTRPGAAPPGRLSMDAAPPGGQVQQGMSGAQQVLWQHAIMLAQSAVAPEQAIPWLLQQLGSFPEDAVVTAIQAYHQEFDRMRNALNAGVPSSAAMVMAPPGSHMNGGLGHDQGLAPPPAPAAPQLPPPPAKAMPAAAGPAGAAPVAPPRRGPFPAAAAPNAGRHSPDAYASMEPGPRSSPPDTPKAVPIRPDVVAADEVAIAGATAASASSADYDVLLAKFDSLDLGSGFIAGV